MTVVSKIYEFSARDGMKITGDYTFHEGQKKEKIMLIFPGMTAVTYLYVYVALRDELVEKGWDVFIVNAYSSEKVGESFPRSLSEITMKRHVEDFEDIVAHFKEKYSNVYASGHSIGGRILIFANNKSLSGQVLLDPSGDTSNEAYAELRQQCYKYSGSLNCKYMDWGDGVFYPIGGIFEELDCCPFSIVSKLVERLSVPTLFVAAGAVDYAKVYQKHINNICKYVEIEGAGHDFIEFGAVKKIAGKTLKFFS
ncbi:MAG: alpha/beta hydrolase [Alphaproteobacteria bacterium]